GCPTDLAFTQDVGDILHRGTDPLEGTIVSRQGLQQRLSWGVVGQQRRYLLRWPALLFDDWPTELDAFVAYKDTGAGNECPDLGLRFPAEGTTVFAPGSSRICRWHGPVLRQRWIDSQPCIDARVNLMLTGPPTAVSRSRPRRRAEDHQIVVRIDMRELAHIVI